MKFHSEFGSVTGIIEGHITFEVRFYLKPTTIPSQDHNEPQQTTTVHHKTTINEVPWITTNT